VTPWSEAGSRFTAPFERVVIDWLRAAILCVVARRRWLTCVEVDGIIAHAVARGRDVGQAAWAGCDVPPEALRVRDGVDGPGREAGALGAGRADEGVGGRAFLGAGCTSTRVGGGSGDGPVAAVHGRRGTLAAERSGLLRPLPRGEAPRQGGEHSAQRGGSAAACRG
jgi:hypothetical protein